MKNFNFMFDIGFGYPVYLAHMTIGVGTRTIWLSISTNNWNRIEARRKKDRFAPASACFSVFTATYTD